MNSYILQFAAKYVRWLLIVFSIIALYRGHNAPGGGFIGGLLAALAIVYNGLAFETKTIQKKMKIKPQQFTVLGLSLVSASLFPSLLNGDTLMTGIWWKIPLPFIEDFKIGTPFIFDIGVFFTVIGVTLLFFFTFTNNESGKEQPQSNLK